MPISAGINAECSRASGTLSQSGGQWSRNAEAGQIQRIEWYLQPTEADPRAGQQFDQFCPGLAFAQVSRQTRWAHAVLAQPGQQHDVCVPRHTDCSPGLESTALATRSVTTGSARSGTTSAPAGWIGVASCKKRRVRSITYQVPGAISRSMSSVSRACRIVA